MSIGGVGSSDYISQLLYLEGEPLRRLQAKKSGYDVQLGVLTDLRSKINAFKTLVADFAEVGATSALRQYGVTSSNPGVVTAVASGTGSVANHAIQVEQLATAHALASTPLTGSDPVTLPPRTYTFDITVAGETASVNVDVTREDTHATLLDKVDEAISSAGLPVFASVITSNPSTDAKQLLIRAKDTGEAGAITALDERSGGRLLRYLGLADIGQSETVAAQDAKFTIDDVAIQAPSNEVDGVVPGIVFSLRSAAPGTVVNLSIDYDNEKVKEKVDELLGAFNDIMGFLGTKLASGDETGEGRGDLAGNLTYTSLRNDLKLSLARRLGDGFARDEINSLDDVGLDLSRNGTLSLSDEEAFFNALTTTPDGVEAYFGSDDGVFKRLENIVKAITKVGGGLDLSRDLLDSRQDILDLRIERQENFLERRERQLRDEFGRLSQFIATLSAQQAAIGSLFGGGGQSGAFF